MDNTAYHIGSRMSSNHTREIIEKTVKYSVRTVGGIYICYKLAPTIREALTSSLAIEILNIAQETVLSPEGRSLITGTLLTLSVICWIKEESTLSLISSVGCAITLCRDILRPKTMTRILTTGLTAVIPTLTVFIYIKYRKLLHRLIIGLDKDLQKLTEINKKFQEKHFVILAQKKASKGTFYALINRKLKGVKNKKNNIWATHLTKMKDHIEGASEEKKPSIGDKFLSAGLKAGKYTFFTAINIVGISTIAKTIRKTFFDLEYTFATRALKCYNESLYLLKKEIDMEKDKKMANQYNQAIEHFKLKDPLYFSIQSEN